MSGQDGGLLAGLPLSIKDLTAVKGVRFTSGSRTLADFISPHDSPVSERVRRTAQPSSARPPLPSSAARRRAQPAHRRHPQPLEPRQDHRRLLLPAPAKRRRRHHPVRARDRRRRLDPDSVLVLRPVRDQGAVRPRSGVSGGGDADARPCRPDGAHGARCGAAAHRHLRLRRAIRRASPPRCRTFSAPASNRRNACGSPGARRSATPGRRRKWWRSPARPRACSRRWAARSSWSRRCSTMRELWMAEFYAGVGQAQEAADRAPRRHRSGRRRGTGERARPDDRGILPARVRALRVSRAGAASSNASTCC